MELLSLSEVLPADIQLNEWIFDTIRPYLHGNILEANSEFHTISSLFVEKGYKLHLSTGNKALREQILTHYQGIKQIRKVHSINFHRLDFTQAYQIENVRQFDTILLLNAVHSGSYDYHAIQNAQTILKDEGFLILMMPAFTAVYNNFELNHEDLKVYDRTPLKHFLGDSMEILKTRYFYLMKEHKYDRTGLSVIAIVKNNRPSDPFRT
jgi:SAM-dependent methyltransferase